LLEAKKLSEENFYTKGLANSLIALGKKYQNISKYGEAMQSSLQAMELCCGLKDKKGESDCLDILGGVYNFLGDYKKRLDCNLKCLILRQEIKDIGREIATLNNIGDTYMVMGDYKNALIYFNKCISFSDLDNHNKAIVYYNIGEVYFLLQKYQLADKNISKGLSFGKKVDYWEIIIASYQIKAKMHIIAKENEKAIYLLDKAKKIAIIKSKKEEEYPLYQDYAEV